MTSIIISINLTYHLSRLWLVLRVLITDKFPSFQKYGTSVVFKKQIYSFLKFHGTWQVDLCLKIVMKCVWRLLSKINSFALTCFRQYGMSDQFDHERDDHHHPSRFRGLKKVSRFQYIFSEIWLSSSSQFYFL